MPAGATSLSVLGPATNAIGTGITYAETSIDATNGNKFDNDGDTELVVRNTTAGAIVLDFYADTPDGNEVKVASRSVPGSGTGHGTVVLGPFKPERFNNHNTTEVASSGKVIMKPASGITGDLVVCAIKKNKSLRS